MRGLLVLEWLKKWNQGRDLRPGCWRYHIIHPLIFKLLRGFFCHNVPLAFRDLLDTCPITSSGIFRPYQAQGAGLYWPSFGLPPILRPVLGSTPQYRLFYSCSSLADNRKRIGIHHNHSLIPSSWQYMTVGLAKAPIFLFTTLQHQRLSCRIWLDIKFHTLSEFVFALLRVETRDSLQDLWFCLSCSFFAILLLDLRNIPPAFFSQVFLLQIISVSHLQIGPSYREFPIAATWANFANCRNWVTSANNLVISHVNWDLLISHLQPINNLLDRSLASFSLRLIQLLGTEIYSIG